MKRVRWVVISLVVLVALAGGALLAASFYLRSSGAARRAEAALTEAIGLPVRIREVDGSLFGSSSGRGIEIFEENLTDLPWISVEEVDADLSVLDLLRGKFQQGTVTLRGAKVRLRFDAQNRLLTRLPQAREASSPPQAPRLKLDNSEIRIEQQGRSPFVLSGISASVGLQEDAWILDGQVIDPEWGTWSARGRLDPEGNTTRLTLAADPAQLTPERLRSIPFVTPGVWEQVVGTGPARAVVDITRARDGFHYRVDLDLRGTAVQVSSIGLDSAQTQGKILVEDGLVVLRDLKGQSAGGRVEASGDLDFRKIPWKFTLTASTERTDLQTFTRTWGLPPQLRDISGKLTGDASLVLTIDEKLHITGRGQGRVEDAVVPPDRPGRDPIKINNLRLRLVYVDGKPQFSTEMSFKPRIPESLMPVTVFFPTSTSLHPFEEPPAMDAGGVRGLLDYPGRAVWWLQRGIELATRRVTETGKAVVAALPRRAPRAKPGTTYFEASFGFTDVDLGQLIERFKLPAPFPVAGKGSLQVQVALPVETPNDLSLYRASGKVDLARLKLADLELRDVVGRVKLDQGILTVDQLSGKVPDGDRAGEFRGQARLQLAPLKDLTADLALEHIPLSRVASVVPVLAQQPSGSFSGKVQFRSPAQSALDVTTWEVTGEARTDRLRLVGIALDRASTRLRVRGGELTLTDTALEVEGLTIRGGARLTLRDRLAYRIELATEKAELKALQKLLPEWKAPPAIQGQLATSADIRGTLTPFQIDASGRIESRELRLSDVKLESLSSDWKLGPQRVTFSSVDALLHRGRIGGTASVPLRPEETGEVSLTIKGLDAASLLKDLPGLPIRLEGEMSGSLEGTLSEASGTGERSFASRLNIEAPRLKIQNIPVDRLQARVGYRRGVVRYHLEGDALSGRVSIDGRWPAAPAPAPDAPPRPEGARPPLNTEGTLNIRRARLGQLLRALAGRDVALPLRGQIDLQLNYGPGAGGEVQGSGRLSVTRLRLDQTELASRLVGDVRLRNGVLELPEFAGEAAGGFARLTVRVGLRSPERGVLSLRLDRVEAGRLLAILGDSGLEIEGPTDVRLRTTVGREWHGDGDAVLARGRVQGIEVLEWRVPFRFSFAPGWGTGQLDVPEFGAQVGLGRASGRAHLNWDGGTRLDGQVRFNSVEVRSLGRAFLEYEQQLGAGRATGRFDFSSRDLRSARDLTGRLEIDFRQAQAFEMPILSRVTPFLRGVSGATNFETGRLEANLSQGVWRIPWLGLESRVLRLFAEGTITMQGRLDLRVLVRTGELLVNPVLLRLIGLSVGQPLPLEVLARASDWLSNRVIHLQIDGTVRSPTVRVNTAALLTEGAVRFFLLQASPTTTPRPGR